MSAKTIYDKFRAAGMTHEGACGMLGNAEAESSLIANIAQRGMTELSDAAYTAKFDSNPAACYRDGVGYGLCQWTYWTRKQKLSKFANSRGKSVGDEDMQVDFIIHELRKDFPSLWSFLCTTDDMYAATERICTEFERPAVNNVDRRYEFAQKWDKQFGNGSASTPSAPAAGVWFPPDLSILILQSVLVGNGYNTDITGYKNADFLAKLREFVTDIGG